MKCKMPNELILLAFANDKNKNNIKYLSSLLIE